MPCCDDLACLCRDASDLGDESLVRKPSKRRRISIASLPPIIVSVLQFDKRSSDLALHYSSIKVIVISVIALATVIMFGLICDVCFEKDVGNLLMKC